MTPNPLVESSPLLQRLFGRIPADIAASFSTEQLTVLHNAMLANQPRKHTIDIRLSIPVIGMYLVVLGGKERRSKTRLRQDRRMHLFWTFSNIIFLFSILFGLGTLAAGLYLILAN